MYTLLRFVSLAAAVVATSVGHAQMLLDTSLTLGKKPDPVILEFQAAAGNYRITVTDFGTPAGPVRMGRIDAAVLRGSELVTSVGVTSAGANVGTKNFSATAGIHRLVFIGQPASPALVGSAGVRVDDPVSGAVLLDTVQVFTVPPAPTASPADFPEDDFDVAAGTYTFEVTDFALPQAMTLNVAVAPRSNPGQLTLVTPGVPIQLTAGAADTFQVFVHAELASGAQRGLLGLNLRDTGTGATVAAAVHEVGEWPYRYPFDVASSGTVNVALHDLGFPFALTGLAGEVVHDGRRALPTLTAPATSSFAAGAGAYTVYVNATAAAAGPGSFGLQVAPPAPAPALIDKVQNVVTPGPVTDLGTIDTFFDIATAGDYTLTLTDFGVSGFFDAFTSIQLALTRDNQIVQTLNAPGAFTFTAATPGRYNVAIIADPAGAAGEGLLGVRVQNVSSNAIVYDRTEAVGTDFITSTVDVTSAQSVDVRLADLGFPATFGSIKVAVTRGAQRVGEIIGAGTFSFQATPGTYVVNLLAAPNAAVGYSTLGLTASVTPPVPGVVLGASATSVTAGGTVTLTWSSAATTGCTASGGWTGARQPNGSESVGPLNAATTFTLSCVGPGGSKDATVSVAITAAQRSGGGGAVDWWLIAMMAAAALFRRNTRHRATAAP